MRETLHESKRSSQKNSKQQTLNGCSQMGEKLLEIDVEAGAMYG